MTELLAAAAALCGQYDLKPTVIGGSNKNLSLHLHRLAFERLVLGEGVTSTLKGEPPCTCGDPWDAWGTIRATARGVGICALYRPIDYSAAMARLTGASDAS